MNLFDQKIGQGYWKLQGVAGEIREFLFADGQGGVQKVNLRCIWARDVMKTSPVAVAAGVFFADIICTISEDDLIAKNVRLPMEGEFLDSPAYVKYEVVGVVRGSGIVTLSLNRKAPRD